MLPTSEARAFRGEIQCIGATTPGEYRKSIEKDRSLERRFQAVKVPPPDEINATKILSGLRIATRSFTPSPIRRRHQLRGLAFEPLHPGPIPARQGH